MAYTERQQQMLAWMGIRVWQPPALDDVTAPSAATLVAEPTPGAAVAAAPEAPAPRVPQRPAPTAPPVARAPVAPAPVGRTLSPAPARRVDIALDTSPELALGGSEVASLDWPALRAAVEGCRACALCESRRHTVFGVGNERAHWMIVGEAPGEQEDLRGEPFVGPAGQLLDAMLQALGLTRKAAPAERQVFIANTLKCRPPRNRNPAPQELAQCEPYLQRQLALVQPRVILAMGRFAVQQLLRSTLPIGKLRGQVHSYQGIPLVVTYHPAYLLRNPVDKARAWDDLCLAASLMEQASGAG